MHFWLLQVLYHISPVCDSSSKTDKMSFTVNDGTMSWSAVYDANTRIYFCIELKLNDWLISLYVTKNKSYGQNAPDSFSCLC